MAYRIAPFPMTVSDLQSHSSSATFSTAIFRAVLQQLTRFKPRHALGSSTIAELLVDYSYCYVLYACVLRK